MQHQLVQTFDSEKSNCKKRLRNDILKTSHSDVYHDYIIIVPRILLRKEFDGDIRKALIFAV